jgi:membrane protease YdiL (CAAX protease family)
MSRPTTVHRIGLFIGITYLLALLIALVLPDTSDAAPVLSVFVPVISAAIVISLAAPARRRRAEWRQVGLSRAGLTGWLPALLAVVAVAVVSFGAAQLLGVARFRAIPESFVDGFVVELVLVTVLILGEEIGWRGFLLFRLAQVTTLRRAALVTGLAHGLFHLPLYLLSTTYEAVGSRWLIVPVAMAVITLAGVFYAWLRLTSGSIWPVAFAHSAFNTVFGTLTAAAAASSPAALAYVAGEGGVVTLAAVALVAWWLLRRSAVFNKDTPIARAATRPSPLQPVTPAAGSVCR